MTEPQLILLAIKVPFDLLVSLIVAVQARRRSQPTSSSSTSDARRLIKRARYCCSIARAPGATRSHTRRCRRALVSRGCVAHCS